MVIDTENFPTVEVVGQGPSAADLNETVTQALNLCQVRDSIRGTRYRVLSPQFLDDGTKTPNNGYQAAVYDYTNARTLLVTGIPFDPTTVSATEANSQPFPDAEELAEAGRIAGAQPNDIVHGSMPPFETTDFPNGTSHRLLNIAITSTTSSRVVQVNMNNRTVEHLHASSEKPLSCSAPPPKDGTIVTNRPGEAHLVIRQGGRVLWTFRAIRPAASSGHEGSAIELRDVRYKGKLVLFQAHAPILNVEYPPPFAGCGPTYRDVQNYEWPFKCDAGSTLAPGFRLCKSPPKTILDYPYDDSGDFTGVAVYVNGLEVVLKSQLTAGWYRYVSEWRFHVDGTLKPRFGFGAVLEKPRCCVCKPHHHHVYWRFDFDIVSAGNNLVREFNNPPIGISNYHEKVFEIKRPKDQSRHRRWEVSNMRSGHTYSLTPGANDGSSSAFGVGDLWVLKYRGTELDDYPHGTNKEDIDRFVNGELVKDTDVVLWYGAHFKHVESYNLDGSDHVVGPDIRPVSWP